MEAVEGVGTQIVGLIICLVAVLAVAKFFQMARLLPNIRDDGRAARSSPLRRASPAFGGTSRQSPLAR